MNKAAGVLCMSFYCVACHSLYRPGRPVCADVGKKLRPAGEELHKKHPYAVEHIVLGRQYVGLPYAVPVKRGVEDCLGEVAVRVEIGPLPLPLKAGGSSVVPQHLLLVAGWKIFIAAHQVLYYQSHFHNKLPVGVLALARPAERFGVLVKALPAVFFCPGKRPPVLFMVVNAFVYPAEDFDFIDRLDAHAEIILKKVMVNNRAADTHADRTYLKVGFPPH